MIEIEQSAEALTVYWVTRVESTGDAGRPKAMEVWYRFPKFIIGFLAASVVFSPDPSGGGPP